jgi:hypothetical protein
VFSVQSSIIHIHACGFSSSLEFKSLEIHIYVEDTQEFTTLQFSMNILAAFVSSFGAMQVQHGFAPLPCFRIPHYSSP